MSDVRPFPIQSDAPINPSTCRVRVDGVPRSGPACTVPWWLAEIAHTEYERRYHNGQSMERIAQRGGFGRYELVHLIACSFARERFR